MGDRIVLKEVLVKDREKFPIGKCAKIDRGAKKTNE